MLAGQGSQTQQSSCQLDANRQADQSSNGVTERNPEPPAAEWEQRLAEQNADTAISHLFEDEQELQEAQQHISLPGMPILSVHSVSRSHRHTLVHTGEPPTPTAPPSPYRMRSTPAAEALSQGKRCWSACRALQSSRADNFDPFNFGTNTSSSCCDECAAVDAAGLMLWESAPALAAYLLANPHLLSSTSHSPAPCSLKSTVCTFC